MENIKLEICVYNIQSCLAAEQGGADRIELCASMPEGGITPSYALIEQAKENLNIEVMVMVRPRGGDFFYDDWEFKQMRKDIELCKKIGVSGVVFGVLNNDGSIDKERNKILLDVAGDMQTCFHRAVDMSSDYVRAVEDIAALGFTRILTSGAKNKAMEGLDNIQKISELLQDKIEIMAGSGVNPNNIQHIYNRTKVQAFHFSAKKIVQGGMIFKNPVVSMGGFAEVSEYDIAISDVNEIRKAKSVINLL